MVFAVKPVSAEELLFSRKLYAYIGLGASAVFFKEAYDSRRKGSDLYDRYEEAQSSLRAQELYDETRRYDTRGVVFGVLGMGTLAYSIHVLRSQPAEELPLPRRAEPMQLKGVEVGVEADVLRRKMGLVLSRRW